jgi:hypothetical protein
MDDQSKPAVTSSYRAAYRMARALAEVCLALGVRRSRLSPPSGDAFGTILSEVARRLRVSPRMVCGAVEDALRGRRPRR